MSTRDSLEGLIVIGAKYMAADRPDLWTVAQAEVRLRDWVATVIDASAGGTDNYPVFVASGSFTLMRTVDNEGEIEWNLFRNIISYNHYEPEGLLYDWMDSSTNTPLNEDPTLW